MGRASTAKRRRREEAARRDAEAAKACARLDDGQCLVCRRSDGGFTSREHPFPESLGNDEIALPPGVVCDHCNNGPLSVLDQTLCDFIPVKMRRTMLGVESKAGAVPTTRFSTGTVEHIGPAELRFSPNGNKEMLRETFRVGDSVGLKFEFSGGSKLTPRYASRLSRALLKTALELAWLDHESMMLEPRFDHIRAAILNDPYNGFLIIGKTGDPDDEAVSSTYNFALEGPVWRMWVVTKVFGLTLATDSRLSSPPVDLDARANVLRFTTGDWKPTRPSSGAHRTQRP